jgi:putative flavoprotein involved in K+ transport
VGAIEVSQQNNATYAQTIVIGGGQAGLSVGYFLQQYRLPFVILDANAHVGDAWRNRWDSLRLFTPARFISLAGMPYPGPSGSFPTKDQVADYLSSYAHHFQLPVVNGVRVDRLWKEDGRFHVRAGSQHFTADNVVVAMANYQVPRVPAYARELDSAIVHFHSHYYRNPSQLREGGVLIVGLGNSGADIAIEVARTHPTWVSGTETGAIPWPIDGFFGRNILFRAIRFLGHHVLSLGTPIGRKVRPKMLRRAAPLIRVKPQDLINAGIERVPRTVGVKDGLPVLADGRTPDVKNVIWCTGYHHGFPWMDLPIYPDGHQNEPMHDRGIVHNVPGLYFVGLHFLYAMSSATLTGVGRDAERIVDTIAARVKLGRARTERPFALSKVADAPAEEAQIA